MTMVVQGLLSVEEMLINLDREGARRVVRELYQQAIKARDLARKFAPTDDGNLEEAIKVRPDELGIKRDVYGRFARTEVEVYIDMDMPIDGRDGKTVGDYAYIQHEWLTPYGPWKLGQKSLAKQASQSEQVGGGFLERAAQEIEYELEGALLDILRDL